MMRLSMVYLGLQLSLLRIRRCRLTTSICNRTHGALRGCPLRPVLPFMLMRHGLRESDKGRDLASELDCKGGARPAAAVRSSPRSCRE